MENNSADTVRLIERAQAGDQDAFNAIFARYRDRLRRMVDLRLDTRMQARLDASDVVQEAYLDAAQRLDEYLRDPKLPLFLWLRLVVGGFLNALQVIHLGDLSARNELDADDLCTWAELVSGQRVHEGGGVTNLTADEWLQRWRAFRRRHPANPPLPWNERLEQ